MKPELGTEAFCHCSGLQLVSPGGNLKVGKKKTSTSLSLYFRAHPLQQ